VGAIRTSDSLNPSDIELLKAAQQYSEGAPAAPKVLVRDALASLLACRSHR
jgi:hypothetical protein